MAVSRAAVLVLDIEGNAKREAERTASAMGKLDVSMTTVAKGAAATAAALVAAGAAMIGLQNDLTNTVDQMNTLAQASGLSIETVNGLRQAAKATGKTLEQLVPQRLARNMLAAEQGSKNMIEAFKAAGVEFDDAGKILGDADQTFRTIIDTLGSMEDRTLAAGLAAQLMGAQGRQMLSAFDNSAGLDRFVSRAGQFGIKVGPQAVQATADWQRATANLSLALEDVKQRLVELFGPGLSVAANNAAGLIVFITSLVDGALRNFAGRFAAFGEVLVQAIKNPLKAANLNAEFARIFAPDPQALAKIIGDSAKRATAIMGGGATGGSFGGKFGLELGGLGAGAGAAGAAGGGSPAPVPVEIDALDIGMQNMLNALEHQADLALQAAQQRQQLVGLQQAANANLAGLGGVKLGVIGSLVTGAFKLLVDSDEKVRQILRTAEAMPDRIGSSFETLMTKVIPRFLSRLPEFLGGLLVRMPAAIARGIVNAIPAIALGIGRAFKRAVQSILDFFRGGEDRNVLTGRKGKVLGTSFKKGEFSLFGFFNNDDRAQGGKGADPGLAKGTRHVPRTGLQLLHEGEMVVPEHRTRMMGGGGAQQINVSIGSLYPANLADFIREIQAQLGTYGLNSSLTPQS